MVICVLHMRRRINFNACTKTKCIFQPGISHNYNYKISASVGGGGTTD